ncbi:MAG TPA: protein kinase [Pyrinomonadaceae bacterium]|jgi:serine/threonine protein kinase/tetratricopeptide (TPR) repeat protein
MTPERWAQIEEVFQTALDLPAGERQQYVAAACAGDEDLRAQVAALLAQYEEAGDFIETPAFAQTEFAPPPDPLATTPTQNANGDDPAIGRRVGAYKIVREIGRGGMGAVYLAERADSEFRRRVAVKLIKRGMDTDFILRRFRNERQILAALDHPYIARLLDGGTTDDALPYFVMEYIEGLPVYRYCDEQKLTVAERLELFRYVCDAVHYAHRHYVIHRDIKPSNIMVTADGVPKLLDFGIAKVLNPELADVTSDPTATAMRLMTPEYAAPEQVQGQAVTPATDVYSLGVLLYELLTGHRPYRLRNRAPHEVARVICEEEPAPLSAVITRPDDLLPGPALDEETTTLNYLYWSRRTTVELLRRELGGDLNNIVMKALRKEPEQRYQSAEQLRDDITRYLEGRPVSAPPYYQEAAREALLHVSDMPTGDKSLAVLPLKMLDPRRSEETGDDYLCVGLADALITRLSAVRRFAVRPTSSVLRYARPDADPLEAGRELSAAYVLDGRIRRAGESLRITVQLLDVRDGGTVWAGQFDEKFTDVLQLEDALTAQVAEAILPHLTGDERQRLAKRGTNDAEAYEAYLRGRYHWNTFTEESLAKALVNYNRAVARDEHYALAYAGIADYYNMLGVYAVLPPQETAAAAREAAARAVQLDDTLAEAHAALGIATLTHDFDWAAAGRHLRRAVELNPNYATGRLWYCSYLGMSGRFDEALVQAFRALELDPLTPLVQQTLCWTHYYARRYEESIAAAHRLTAREPRYSLAHVALCLVLTHTGAYEEAVAEGEKAVELLGRTPYALSWLAAAHAAAGQQREARALLAEIHELSATRYVAPYLLALVHCNLGDEETALAELERAFETRDPRLCWLGVEPQFDTLRGRPRFDELLRRTGNPLAPVAAGAHEPNTGPRTIAVLPLHVLGTPTGENTGDEYLGVALADALVARLSAVRRLVVRPTASVLRYRGADVDPLTAGRDLGVDFIVGGTIRRVGTTLRVTAQLLSVHARATRWAGRFDEQKTDVLQLEDSLSEQVARALIPQLSGDEQRRLSKRGTNDGEAYEAYLRGRYHWNTFTEEGFALALENLNRAVALDPDYALAYTGIADYYNFIGVFGVRPFAEAAAAAKTAALKAIALDDALGEAYSALAFALDAGDFDWAQAEQHYRRALELNPNDAKGHQWYGFHLAAAGRADESLAAVRRAQELAPFSPINIHALAWCSYHARRFEEARAAYRTLLTATPTYAYGHTTYSLLLRHLGEHDAAIAAAERGVELGGEGPLYLSFLGAAYAAAGRVARARAVLARLAEMSARCYVSPYHVAFIHLWLGERERALALLEEAYRVGDGWLIWLGVEPELDALRAESRFEELLRRTNNPARLLHGAAARHTPPRPPDATSAGATATPSGGTPSGGAQAPRGTKDEEAQKLYTAGRYYATRRTADGLRQAIDRLEKAVARDPQFALAYAELADCYALLNWYVEPPPAEAWARAKDAAQNAVRADDTLAEAHASLGFVMCHYDRDFEGAERELRRAVELQPDNAVARRWHAFNLSAMGRHDDALAEIRRAQEINPRSPVIATAVANILFLARRYDEAVAQCHRALELDPGSVAAHVVLRWACEMQGCHDEALAAYEQEAAFAGDTPTTLAKRAHVLAATGKYEEARQVLDELLARRTEEWVTAYEVAVVHALLGDRDGALRWLAEAEREHAVGFTFAAVDPHLDALRADPRFDELLRRARRPPAAAPPLNAD